MRVDRGADARRLADRRRSAVAAGRTWIDARGDSAFGYGRQVTGYRDLLVSLVRRDITVRYRQTLLGPGWILLQPLLNAGVFTFLLVGVASVDLPGDINYFAFAIVGLALWTGLSQTVTRGTQSLLNNVDLITKIYFPRFLLPLSAALSSALDCAVMLAVALAVTAAVGPDLPATIALAPFVVLPTLVLGLSIASVLSALLVRFRDVAYAVPVFVQSLLFLTPVLYPVSSVPERLRPVVEVNPLTMPFELLRWAVLGTAFPPGRSFVYSGVATVVLFGLALLAFSRLERDMADVI